MKELTMEDYRELVETYLLDFVPDIDHKSNVLNESIRYSLVAGGKRIRPILLLATCNFLGGDMKAAMPYACAIEYMHTYSLIHDDLPAMDNDDLRRGIPTNHKVYGDAIAILAGDGLQSAAFEVMNKDMLMYFDNEVKLKARVKASYEIVKGSGCRGMVAGQISDIDTQNKQCSKEMLDYIHINKTGALIIAAVRAGAHLGNVNDKDLQNLSIYAENLGLAFQVADDLLDICGNEEEMGKKAGVDAANNKSTYPALYGVEESRKRLEELTQNAIDIMAPYYDNAEFFTTLASKLATRCK